MRNQRSILALGGLMVLTWCVVPVLADEVAAPWGTVHGNLSGTAAVDKTAYPAYEFKLSAGVQYSFELDVKAAPLSADLPDAQSGITFDEAGNLYWKCQWPVPKVLSVTPDGQPRWTANTDGDPLGSENRHYLGVDVDDRDSAAPVVGDGGTGGRVYAIGEDGSGNGIAVAYLKSNGMKVWETLLPNSYFAGQHDKLTPVLYGGKLYVMGAPSLGRCTVYQIDSATGTIEWSNTVGTTNAITAAPGGQMAFVPNAFATGEHGLYFHLGDVDRAYGIRIIPGSGASDAWGAPVGHTAGHQRSHVIYSATTGLLYVPTWADSGYTFYVYDPVTGAKSSVLAPGTGHGYYDVAMLDFNGTDVIAGGFSGTIQRYMDPNDGTGNCTFGTYYTTEWFGEARSVGGLYQDAAGKSIYLSGTNSRTDLNPDYTSRVVAINVTDGVLIDDCADGEDGPLYIDNLVISTNGVSVDPLVIALDVGGFEGYTPGTIVGQVNSAQGGTGLRDATWVEVGNLTGVLDIIADPTGAGKGQILSMDVPGSCDQGITAVWAQFDKILNGDGLVNSNGTIVIEFDQYRTDQGDTIWMSHSADYGQWWSYQPAQGGTITTKHWGPPGVSITTGQWQHITFTFDLLNGTITVSNGVDTSAPVDIDFAGQDPVFDGFEFEVQDSPAVDNPALRTPTLFEYNTGPANNNNHGFNLLCGPVLGPVQPDGIQRAYYFNWQEPHKLAAIQNNFPPEFLGCKSVALHGEPETIDFEAPTYALGSLGGQNGWSVLIGDGSAEIVNSNGPALPGTQCVEVTNTGGEIRLRLDVTDLAARDGGLVHFQYDIKNATNRDAGDQWGKPSTFRTRLYDDQEGYAPIGNMHYDGGGGPACQAWVGLEPDGDPAGWDPEGGPAWGDLDWHTVEWVLDFSTRRFVQLTFDGQVIPHGTWFADWNAGDAGGVADSADWVEVRLFADGNNDVWKLDNYVLRKPMLREIALDITGTGAAATSEPRNVDETTLVFEFSEAVSAPAGAITINGPGGPYAPVLTVNDRFVTAVVSPALADGTYTATITGIIDSSGQGVVGDADVEFVVKVGDADGDHDVDLVDYAAFQNCAGVSTVGCLRSDFYPSYEIDAEDIPPFVTGLEASGPQ